MYRIKANGNYNIVIRDIGVYFSHPTVVTITEEQYKKSRDLQIMISRGAILIQKASQNAKSIDFSTNVVVSNNDESKIFVREGNKDEIDTKSFIKEVDEQHTTVVHEVGSLVEVVSEVEDSVEASSIEDSVGSVSFVEQNALESEILEETEIVDSLSDDLDESNEIVQDEKDDSFVNNETLNNKEKTENKKKNFMGRKKGK